MSDLPSIARPYAKAIFDLALEQKSQTDWANILRHFGVLASDPEFLALSQNPLTAQIDLGKLMLGTYDGSRPEGVENLVRMLIQHRRLLALPAISTRYQQLLDEAQKCAVAHVVTAMELSYSQKENLKGVLESRLNLDITIEEQIDESLVGGAIVRVGDWVVDGSANGRIKTLDAALRH